MRERTKHKDDYRYVAKAQYLIMGIIWGLIALSDYLDYGVRMPYFWSIYRNFVFSLFMCIRSILNHN